MAKTIVDPGSCHDGEMHKAVRLVELAADVGADAIKFQLLTDKESRNGNISIDWEWLPDLITIGKRKHIEVFASVFDRSGWDYVIKCGCKSVKLAYSQQAAISTYPHRIPLERVYVSQDVMSPAISLRPIPINKQSAPPPMELIRLYCLPVYPVPYLVDFEGLFPRFNGFSSHCLGIEQEIRAVKAGAEVLEFHMCGDWVSDTPDGRFAKTPAMAEKLISTIRNMTPQKYDGRDFS